MCSILHLVSIVAFICIVLNLVGLSFLSMTVPLYILAGACNGLFAQTATTRRLLQSMTDVSGARQHMESLRADNETQVNIWFHARCWHYESTTNSDGSSSSSSVTSYTSDAIFTASVADKSDPDPDLSGRAIHLWIAKPIVVFEDAITRANFENEFEPCCLANASDKYQDFTYGLTLPETISDTLVLDQNNVPRCLGSSWFWLSRLLCIPVCYEKYLDRVIAPRTFRVIKVLRSPKVMPDVGKLSDIYPAKDIRPAVESLKRNAVIAWSSAEVEEWVVRNIELGEPSADSNFRKSVTENCLSGEDLLELTNTELRDELGVAAHGHRKLILRRIGALKTGGA